MDATSASNRGHRSLLMMHYPDVIAIRNSDEKNVGFEMEYKLPEVYLFKGYRRNLTMIGKKNPY